LVLISPDLVFQATTLNRVKQERMMQLELEYKAYQRNSDTSKSAWKHKKDKITLKDKVFDLLLNNPLANHQIAETMEIPLSSVCARIRELQIDGIIEDSGKTVKSKYGRECVIWQRKK
jgi:predicted Rossmann fold nucleotide-binding protein DprA/Smf involved in DNA uptake